ncbi:hypothetical protein, partial [Sphingobacterium arenae]|uniref:hypothetical protein n=1 Tax=Sphingobacterium arenae TaxID=1280598 RepID=UPI001CC1E2DD
PNRAVKPARADGTAVTGGRVGRCRSLYRAPAAYAGAFFMGQSCFLLESWYCSYVVVNDNRIY